MARVLVVEDNPANLQLMIYLLEAYGHQVATAGTAEAGLEIVRRRPLDLVICDIQLPGMDGYAFARALRAQPVWSRLPLVAVTAFAMVGDRDKVLAAGFDGYLAKPIEPQSFVGQVEQFLGPAARGPAPARAAAPKPAAPAKPAGGPRVLVVDNSPVNLELMRSTLEPFGCAVVCAASAREALSAARREPPDLIVSDLHMPDEDGFDLIRAVKIDPRLRAVPFVFVSSTVWGTVDEQRGLALGAVDFIRRPIEPAELVRRLDRHLPSREGEEPPWPS